MEVEMTEPFFETSYCLCVSCTPSASFRVTPPQLLKKKWARWLPSARVEKGKTL